MLQAQLKLKLNVKQEHQLDNWLWILTGAYNWTIRKIQQDTRDGIYYSKFDLFNLCVGCSTRLGISSHTIQGTIAQAHDAWRGCFEKRAKRPRLKGVRNKLNSIPFPDGIRAPEHHRIKLPKIGVLRFHKQGIPAGKIKCGRIVKRASGWYLCLFIDAERKPIERLASGVIGIDPGFKDLLVTSDGEKIKHPRELERSLRRLGQAQRGKRKRLTARLQEHIRNQRKDRNHKLSLQLVQENIVICFSRDDHVKLAKKFGKSVTSSGHAQLRGMLAYKSRAGGARYLEVAPHHSTRTCSGCGALTGPTGLGGLAVRRWRCGCGAEHDRDVNAAVNTLAAGVGTTLGGLESTKVVEVHHLSFSFG